MPMGLLSATRTPPSLAPIQLLIPSVLTKEAPLHIPFQVSCTFFFSYPLRSAIHPLLWVHLALMTAAAQSTTLQNSQSSFMPSPEVIESSSQIQQNIGLYKPAATSGFLPTCTWRTKTGHAYIHIPLSQSRHIKATCFFSMPHQCMISCSESFL
ncbi:hypothetical protein BT69DRAFT_1146008 [Atractiella rhizophila]|nr:hypothetical protein BT69DRAFT_1146008 [Atractiella rhizophila]